MTCRSVGGVELPFGVGLERRREIVVDLLVDVTEPLGDVGVTTDHGGVESEVRIDEAVEFGIAVGEGPQVTDFVGECFEVASEQVDEVVADGIKAIPVVDGLRVGQQPRGEHGEGREGSAESSGPGISPGAADRWAWNLTWRRVRSFHYITIVALQSEICKRVIH